VSVDWALDERIRVAMFAHLDAMLARRPDGVLTSAEINSFVFEGRSLPLIVQPGIWKPKFLQAALTIRTTYTAPNQPPPYVDQIGEDGLLRYAYQGTNPQASDNRALSHAMAEGVPLAYFVGLAKGVYTVLYPVWIVDAHPDGLQFSVALDEIQIHGSMTAPEPAARAYALRITKQRLHQHVFRAQVLRAYEDTCAMCRLRHAELLDAAHILPDGHPRGEPVVPNGLSLCRIHHAAFDTNIIGVRPDLVIDVRRDVLEEHDGPMLRHGLQELAGTVLTIPRQRAAKPDPLRLEIRYDEFRRAS
jgi:putative restriction endonuclease